MSFPYLINDVVLARVPNGKIYYTKIRSISLARKECVTEFDDGSIATVDWTNIFDVAAETDVIVCVVCKQGDSEPPNEIILCDTCNVGYHQKCHLKTITSQQIAQDKWHCHYCLTKGKNPHVINPFENTRTRSPSKRKRKLRKVEPKPKPKPRKRRKLQRTPPKPSKTTKSYVAKKCTISIVKKSIQEIQTLAPGPSSEGSSCSSEDAEAVSQSPPEIVPSTRSITPPMSLPPPHRPVNAVQPLNHSMVYPACTPPPLQMSPLVKKTPRVISCSPPPLITPRDVTANRDVAVSMPSLPPLQRARVIDCDPLLDAPRPSISPPLKTDATVQFSKLKKPEQKLENAQESPNQSRNTETLDRISGPYALQPPPGPSETGSISGISSEQIRGLYLRLYDFLQQTRAQGNPVIDRDVVQHLISYGNEQIERLSTTGASSNSEQIESTNSFTERFQHLRNSVEINTCTSNATVKPDQLQQLVSKDVNEIDIDNSTELSTSLDDKVCVAESSGMLADQSKSFILKSSGMKEVECFDLQPKLNHELFAESESTSPAETTTSTITAVTEKVVGTPISVVQKQSNLPKSTSEFTSKSSDLSKVTCIDLQSAVDCETSHSIKSKSVLPVTPIMEKTAGKPNLVVKKQEKSSGDTMEGTLKVVSKPTLSTKPIQVVSSSSNKTKSDKKSLAKMVCQPFPPANTKIRVGAFNQQTQRKSLKSKTIKSSFNKKSASENKSVAISRKRKTEGMKCTKPAQKKTSKIGHFSGSTYTAVQAGNSVIIKPNSCNDIPTENSVPVQFVSGQSPALQTESTDHLSMIINKYLINNEVGATEKGKTQQHSIIQSSTQSSSTSVRPESPKICSPALPTCDSSESSPNVNTQSLFSPVSDTGSTVSTTITKIQSTCSEMSLLQPPANKLNDNNANNQPGVHHQADSARSFDSTQQGSSTIRQLSSDTFHTNSQESLKNSAPLPSADRSIAIPAALATDNTSKRPQLRSGASSSSDTKKACPSNRTNLTRGSKIQAKNNIKSFTIFDSYSSLFDSDDDDDVYVSEEPVSQVSSEPTKGLISGYNQTSTRDVNSTQDSKISYTSSSSVERSGFDQMEPSGAIMDQSTETPTAAVFSLDDLIDIQEDDPVQVSSKDLPLTSSSAILFNPLDSIQPENSLSFPCDKDSSEFFASPTTFSPSLNSPQFDFDQFQQNTHTPDALEVEAPVPLQEIQSTGFQGQPLIATAQYISRMFQQTLLVTSAKFAAEIAVRAAVIKLKEERVSWNIVSATLLHALLSAASKKTIKSPAPLQTTNHPPSSSVSESPPQTTFPVASSHNQPSLPITTTYLTRPITPVATGQNPGSVSLPQNACPVPLTNSPSLEANTSTLGEAGVKSSVGIVSRSAAPLYNHQNNKTEISGQCYNCYSPALIACRKCSDALYCSLRCELEHLAIHRRECCKRQP
ncbi:hypothetical protein ACHWQZ_G006048 [Mnemiopsis leidyi]